MIGAGDELVPIDAEPEIRRAPAACPAHRAHSTARLLGARSPCAYPQTHRRRAAFIITNIIPGRGWARRPAAERAFAFAVYITRSARMDASLCSMDAQFTSLRAPGTIGVHPELGNDELRDAADPGRRAVERQHHVHDVVVRSCSP